MLHLAPRAAAYALALLFALAIAIDLLWMPIQVADSLGEILDAQRSPSVWASFTENLGTEAYLRPLRIAQIKALFDVAQGAHYWLVYRGFHALLLIAAVLLFTRTLRVSTAADFAAAAFALVVLIGLNTFRGTVQEAFPINHFLEILLLCLLTLNLARSRGGFWIDVVGALTFVVAALTLESGLLVWVVAASAWAVGWRGISARGLVMLTTLLLGYLYVRFVYLSTGVPAMTERSSGYLLELLDPVEIARRFGAHPLWFHTYNVMASTSAVLFSEPRGCIRGGSSVAGRPPSGPLRCSSRNVGRDDRADRVGLDAARGTMARARRYGPFLPGLCCGPRGKCDALVRLHEGRDHEHGRRLLRPRRLWRHARGAAHDRRDAPHGRAHVRAPAVHPVGRLDGPQRRCPLPPPIAGIQTPGGLGRLAWAVEKHR